MNGPRPNLLLATVLFAASASVVNAQQPSPGRTSAQQQNANPHTVQKQAAPPLIGRSPTKQRRSNNSAVQRISYADALRRYHGERHSKDWWDRHYTVIVLVSGGYYYWDAGYWCPAWGYDSQYQTYDYDGPIYTYGNLLPDQVIINVQRTLHDLGYYAGTTTGSLGPSTRQAIGAFQQDYGLTPTGVVDEPTVRALGLLD